MEKIILICNFSEDPNTGLLKVLGNNYRNTTFVTNHLFNNQGGRFTCLVGNYLYLSHDKISHQYFNKWQLLLIKDSLEPNQYDSNIDFINSYIMHHKTPSLDLLKDVFKKAKVTKKGAHETDVRNGYPLIRDLAEAYNPQSMNFHSEKYDKFIENIIKWFDVDDYLEEVLTFLHNCLIPNAESFPKSLPNSLKVDKQAKNNNALNLYDILKGEKDNGPFGEKYIKALSDLRDELLKDY